MTELMKNPNIMRKVQDELRTLIQGKTFIDENDLPKFIYLKAIVKETFRFHTVAPLLIPHEVSQKCSLDGYDIPPHSLVFVNAWAVGRDPKYWKNPEVFMPERFIESSVGFKGQNFEFIPFGAGKRACPGMFLGLSTVELTLANLLYSFDWELPDGMKKEDIDTDVIPGLTMHKKNPLCLIAKMFPGAT
uniref:Costunolide synthase n=1 Tax=Opuntia streptacantha TaxID=393608 RepID=A0A7C9AQ63_OPUST